MHTCLQEHRDELSTPCRREEIKLMVRQASNIEFIPSVSKSCHEEMNVFCKVGLVGMGMMMGMCMLDGGT